MSSVARFIRTGAAALCAAILTFSAARAETPVYNVGATTTGIPFTFLNIETNQIQGVMVDIAKAIGQKSGFEVSVQQTVFSALIPSLTSGKIDIISAAMLKTAEREKVVSFSDPVYRYGAGLIVKADDNGTYVTLDDLKGEIVGAQVGTVFIDIMTKMGVFKEVRSYDSIGDMVRDLSLGRIKAGVGDQPIVAYQIKQGTFKGVKLSPSFQPVNVGEVCLITRKDDVAMQEKLNKGIAAIKADGTLDGIIAKWGL